MSPSSFLALVCYAALWAALPNIAHAMPEAAAADGDAAVQPGYGWSRPKHIHPARCRPFPPLWAAGETPLTRTFSSRTMVGGAAEPRLQATHRDRRTG